MFSESFMRYLINYQKEDCMVEGETDTVKKIKFKPIKSNEPVKVRIQIKD